MLPKKFWSSNDVNKAQAWNSELFCLLTLNDNASLNYSFFSTLLDHCCHAFHRWFLVRKQFNADNIISWLCNPKRAVKLGHLKPRLVEWRIVFCPLCANWLVYLAMMLLAIRLLWRRSVVISHFPSIGNFRSFCSVPKQKECIGCFRVNSRKWLVL